MYPANVAIAGERIAYAGLRDDMVGPRTTTLDAGGRIYHAGLHRSPRPSRPRASRRRAWPGTCCRSGPRPSSPTACRSGSSAACARSGSWPTRWRARRCKFYWMIRVHAQARDDRQTAGASRSRDIARALDHPVVLRGRRRSPAGLDVWAGSRDSARSAGPGARAWAARRGSHRRGRPPTRSPPRRRRVLSSDHEPITASRGAGACPPGHRGHAA